MKNNKGITLIALVITIIVLLILAGITIAMLTGDNGLLTNASKAKVSQIEAKVDEEVRLAVASTKVFAEQKAVSTSTGYLASANLDDVITQLRKDLTETKGYTKIEDKSTTGENAKKQVQVTFTTADYKSATNNSNASITYNVVVSNNTFTVETPTFVPEHATN